MTGENFENLEFFEEAETSREVLKERKEADKSKRLQQVSKGAQGEIETAEEETMVEKRIVRRPRCRQEKFFLGRKERLKKYFKRALLAGLITVGSLSSSDKILSSLEKLPKVIQTTRDRERHKIFREIVLTEIRNENEDIEKIKKQFESIGVNISLEDRPAVFLEGFLKNLWGERIFGKKKSSGALFDNFRSSFIKELEQKGINYQEEAFDLADCYTADCYDFVSDIELLSYLSPEIKESLLDDIPKNKSVPRYETIITTEPVSSFEESQRMLYLSYYDHQERKIFIDKYPIVVLTENLSNKGVESFAKLIAQKIKKFQEAVKKSSSEKGIEKNFDVINLISSASKRTRQSPESALSAFRAQPKEYLVKPIGEEFSSREKSFLSKLEKENKNMKS